MTFNSGPSGTTWSTQLSLSNRKQRYSSAVFLRPAVTGQQFGAHNSQDAASINNASFRIQRGVARDFGGIPPPTDDLGNPASLQQSQKEFASHFAPPTDDWDRAEKEQWQEDWLTRSQAHAIRPQHDLVLGGRGQFAHLGDPISMDMGGGNAGGGPPAGMAGGNAGGDAGGMAGGNAGGDAGTDLAQAPVKHRDPDAGYADQSPEAKARRAAAREQRGQGTSLHPSKSSRSRPSSGKKPRTPWTTASLVLTAGQPRGPESADAEAIAAAEAEKRAAAEQETRDKRGTGARQDLG